MVSGLCLDGVWRVSGWCLDGVWMVSGWCLDPQIFLNKFILASKFLRDVTPRAAVDMTASQSSWDSQEDPCSF